MDKVYLVADIEASLAKRDHPTVTQWNRLEGRPRQADFTRALRAEVRDALWFLTRQWQMGELAGDDAGTPVLAKIHTEVTKLSKYQPAAGAAQPFPEDVPLEAVAERQPLAWMQGAQPIAFDLRLAMGRQWLRMLRAVGNYAAAYISEYRITAPDPSRREDALYCAHPEVWSTLNAVAGRAMDGGRFYLYLKGDATRHAYDRISVLSGDEARLDALGQRFIEWFEKLIDTPAGGPSAWEPSRLEYRFDCAVPADPASQSEKVLSATEYYQGTLDWHAFDLDRSRSALPAVPGTPPATQPLTQTLIPVPVSFAGMPNPRWWTFEDGRTNFGDVRPDTTDIGKLLLVEFGLVFANDWCLVPVDAPAGSIVNVAGIAVTNVFGERIWVEAAGRAAADSWQRWRMFSLTSSAGQGAPDDSLLLLPTVPKVQQGEPTEEVALVRDEMANMVWGIELRVPMAAGASKAGAEAAAETLAYHRRLVEAAATPGSDPALPFQTDAGIRYEVMNTVPECWIPFISVRVPGNVREMQLQRAAMPRFIPGDNAEPLKVRPRTQLLRPGLDQPQPSPYFVFEEEVPRAGVRVTQAFQRTRWVDGRAVVWLGARKQVGRGEGSSGLAFDRAVPIPPTR